MSLNLTGTDQKRTGRAPAKPDHEKTGPRRGLVPSALALPDQMGARLELILNFQRVIIPGSA